MSSELIDRGDGTFVATDPDAHAAEMARRKLKPSPEQTPELLLLASAIKRLSRDEATARGDDPTFARRSERDTRRRLSLARRRAPRPRVRDRRPVCSPRSRSRSHRFRRATRAGPSGSSEDGQPAEPAPASLTGGGR